MPVRRNLIDEAARRAQRQVEVATAELRQARIAAGLSQGFVADALGCSRQLIGAIEAGELGDIGAIQLARIGAVVGLDVPIHTFAAGSPLRDAGQLQILARFRATLGGAWSWRTEVPVSTDPRDRRAFDALLVHAPHRIAVEAISRLVDAQGQSRAILLKEAAAHIDRSVLVLADSRNNRRALVEAAPTLTPAFPLRSRAVLHALRAGQLPSANGIVLV